MIYNPMPRPNLQERPRRFVAALAGLGEGEAYFIPPQLMTRALEMERSRSDRTGGVFSLLLIEFDSDRRVDLAPILQERLRMTDVPGVMSDGRIALLLPDTPHDGACQVADDLLSLIPSDWDEPRIEILVHPGDDFEDGYPHHRDPAGERLVIPDRNGESAGEEEVLPVDNGVSASVRVHHAQTMRETLARRMPLWKRSTDIAGALFGLAISAPILLVAAAAIKLSSPGPVFFRQERHGFAGRRFKILKLRTMVQEAESQREALAEHNELDGPAFKMACDPRVTRVGEFLRKTSIDELPQFWNVLVGDMSLVGPRPLPTEESMLCDRWHKVRLHAVPGLTCTWQVSGRSQIGFDDWARMDVQYIREMSPLTDLNLMARTVPAVVARDGAY